jgi:PmbA protein
MLDARCSVLTSNQIDDIFARVKKFATTDEVEMLVSGGRFALTRFANNGIHQNVAEENVVVSIRTAIDGKTARATTNKLDDDSLQRAVKAAEDLTHVQQSDPDLQAMVGKLPPAVSDAPRRYFDSTAAITPEDRAAGVGKIVDVAKKSGLVTAGIFSTSESFEAIVNSKGVSAYHPQTSSEISITMLAGNSSGWQKANSPDVRNLDAAGLANVAAHKAKLSADPIELAPGKYTVILEPAAVLDLIGFMFWDFGGQAVLDERSFLNKRIGQKVFGDQVTIHDDAYHPLQSGAQFDGEGVPRKRVTLVEKGVVKNLVYGRRSAALMQKSELAEKLGKIEPTGHGFPLPNDMGDAPMNIVFSGPPATEAKNTEQMIQSTERGVLVTRCWYIREVEPYEKMLTGMTRDGTFLVENGTVTNGILNFRFNQSLVEMLNNIVMMGTSVRASGEEAFDMVVPALTVIGFNFTEVTKF